MTQEAFKAWWYAEGSQAPYTHHDCEEHTMRMCEIAWNKAQALAQEQEPVAWESVYETIIHWDECGGKRSRRELARRIVSLYTAPPQRKPLTDEEILSASRGHYNPYQRPEISFARAIEAAHGIKEGA